MRTSFHHQSEAQPPNGRLTAATSPDTPSAAPASQSVSNASHMKVAQKPRGTARFRTGPAGPRPARSCELRPVRNPATYERTPTQTLPLSASANRVQAHPCFLFSDRGEKPARHVEGRKLRKRRSPGRRCVAWGASIFARHRLSVWATAQPPRGPRRPYRAAFGLDLHATRSSRSPRRRVRCRRHDAAFNVPALKDRRRRMRLKSRAVNASSSMTKTIGFHGAGESCGDFERPVTTYPLDAMAE
jgi:hypothetical protein